jgi:AraC-like DNA-binding protein
MKAPASIISSNVLFGSACYVLGVHDKALKSYLIGKELATITNSPYEFLCLTNIANIRAKLHQYQDALDSYNSILKILDESEQNISTRLSALLGKMLCLTELKRFEEAEKVFDQGTRIAKKNGFQITEGSFKINLGKVHYEKGEYYESIGLLKQGKKMLKATSLQNNLYITDFYIAKNLNKLREYEEALSLLDSIFERIGTDTDTDRIEEMYTLAIEISLILKDRDKELVYQRESQKIITAKNNKETAARQLLFKDDLNDSALENERLANEKKQSLIDKKIIMAVSILLVSILLLIFLSYHRKAKVKEQKFLAIIEDISKKTTPQKTKEPEKTSQSPAIKDEKSNAILEELEALEGTLFYLSADATLHTTAKLLHTNTTYLSKALNAVKKQSFSQYLNKLRIDYVLVKLKEDAVFRSYTIHAISKEIGYKSATTFIKEFKNKTGLNPSYYIKKIKS